MAALAAGVPTVDLDELAPRPCGLVVELAHQLPPTNIADGFRQRPVLDHIFHREAFSTDHLVLVDDLPGEFMKVVKPGIGDFRVAPGHFLLCFRPIVRAFLLTAQLPLRPRQFACVTHRMAGVVDPPTVTGHEQVFQAEINAHHLRRDGQ
ncbi:hypothetical protein VRRI112168_18695 [Vreelandella rituensis]